MLKQGSDSDNPDEIKTDGRRGSLFKEGEEHEKLQ